MYSLPFSAPRQTLEGENSGNGSLSLGSDKFFTVHGFTKPLLVSVQQFLCLHFATERFF
jgi:hypothetical protein